MYALTVKGPAGMAQSDRTILDRPELARSAGGEARVAQRCSGATQSGRSRLRRLERLVKSIKVKIEQLRKAHRLTMERRPSAILSFYLTIAVLAGLSTVRMTIQRELAGKILLDSQHTCSPSSFSHRLLVDRQMLVSSHSSYRRRGDTPLHPPIIKLLE